MSGNTPARAFYEAYGTAMLYPVAPWDDLADDYRAALETGVRAAIAAYIEVNGRDPVDVRSVVAEAVAAPELAAAMAETRKMRDVVCKLLDLFGRPDDRRMCHASITVATLSRYAAEAEVPVTWDGQP